MSSGLFINNELLSLAAAGPAGEIRFFGYKGEDEVFLYYRVDKDKKPPVVPDPEARFEFYPGNPALVGDILKLCDTKGQRLDKTGKKVDWNGLYEKYIQQFLADNADHIPSKRDKTSIKFVPLTGSPPIPTHVETPILSCKSAYKTSYVNVPDRDTTPILPGKEISPGIIPTLASPGVRSPGQLGPTRRI